MADSKKMPIRDIIFGLIGTVLAAGVLWLASTLDKARFDIVMLQQIHEREWPLELDRLSFTMANLEAQIATNEVEIDRLKDQVRDIR